MHTNPSLPYVSEGAQTCEGIIFPYANRMLLNHCDTLRRSDQTNPYKYLPMSGILNAGHANLYMEILGHESD